MPSGYADIRIVARPHHVAVLRSGAGHGIGGVTLFRGSELPAGDILRSPHGERGTATSTLLSPVMRWTRAVQAVLSV